MPIISVIVPVYNAENYLHRCIDSILAQTFTDFELLLINDGSTDNSGEICNAYAQKYPCIRMFHKNNGGVSSARNLGLTKANGEWIVFVDSDDWIEPHYLNVLYQNGKYDFVTCYWRVLNDKNYACIVPAEGEYIGKSEIRTFVDLNVGRLSYPVCRLFRNSIIQKHELSFDERIHYSEDALFIITYLQYVQTVKQLGNIEYNYEKHVGSLSNVIISWKEMDYTIKVLGEQIHGLENILSWNGERMYQYRIWGCILRKYLTFLQDNESFIKCKEALSDIVKNKYVKQCFLPSNCVKSMPRLLLDYLMRNKLFYFAAILLKCECFLAKIGLVKRC